MSHIIWLIFNSLLILNGFDWFDYSFARIVQSETCVTVTDPSLELLEQIEKFIFKIANKRWLLIDCYQNKIEFVLIKLETILDILNKPRIRYPRAVFGRTGRSEYIRSKFILTLMFYPLYFQWLIKFWNFCEDWY